MSPDISRSREAFRYVDPGPVGKRNDHANTRYSHQAATDRIFAGLLSCHAIETHELIHEDAAHAQHGLGYGGKGGVPFDEFQDTRLEGMFGHMTQLQPEDLERAAH